MSEAFPVVYVARHGETAWSLTGQHTGLTDLPLTPNGERNARRLGERLEGLAFVKVFTSPLQRAYQTADWRGSVLWPNSISTWSNGITVNTKGERRLRFTREGRTGTCSEMGALEANRLRRLVSEPTDWCSVLGQPWETCCSFSSGHFIRVLAERWLGLASGICRQIFYAQHSKPERLWL